MSDIDAIPDPVAVLSNQEILGVIKKGLPGGLME